MSLISDQVKKLRDVSDELLKDYPYKYMSEYYELPQPQKEKLSRLMLDAAETIFDLSAKLHTANMERSSAHYNGGWVPCEEQEPTEYGEYMITWTTSYPKFNSKGMVDISEYEKKYEWDDEKKDFKGNWLLPEYIQNYPNVKVVAWMPLPNPYTEPSK